MYDLHPLGRPRGGPMGCVGPRAHPDGNVRNAVLTALARPLHHVEPLEEDATVLRPGVLPLREFHADGAKIRVIGIEDGGFRHPERIIAKDEDAVGPPGGPPTMVGRTPLDGVPPAPYVEQVEKVPRRGKAHE